ncbi:MAG: ABC transporter permease [Acidobacteria bacterium]|nr:ABC transporter permease [Acidobacteriota bacterium]
MNNFFHDLRYSLRSLRKSPAFTFIAIITLALAIGANTAIFSVVHSVLLKPLPFAESGRLVAVFADDAKQKDQRSYLSFDDLRDYQREVRSLENLTGISPQWSVIVTAPGESESLNAFYAAPGVFSLLGVQPALGRGFTAAEDVPNAAPVVVISHRLWQQRFSSDPAVIGKSITLGSGAATIVGVLPSSFRWIEDSDVWLPLSQNMFSSRGRGTRLLTYLGRLKPGVSPESAQSELRALATTLAREYPATNTGIGANLIPLHEVVTGKIRPTLLILFGAVSLVLLIAVANVANLLLARSSVRAREMAIRSSLGASRPRIIRLLLTESVLLALVAGTIGLLISFWGVDLLVGLNRDQVPRAAEISVNPMVLLFSAVVSICTGIAFGLVPAWQISKGDLSESLKEGGRGSLGPARNSARSALVVAEVAVSLVVVAASVLLLRSFTKLQGVDPGFQTQSVLTFSLPMPSQYSDASRRLAFYQKLYERVEALPGVIAAGDGTRLPLSPRGGNPNTSIAVEDALLPPGHRPDADFRRAGRNYFRALGIPVLSGRAFDERDTPQSESVAIVNQAAARLLFPDKDPLGRRVGFGDSATPSWSRIVGVVGDIRHLGLHANPRPEMYICAGQSPPTQPVFVVRTASSPEALVSAIRSILRELDPTVPVLNISTLQQVRYESLAQPRLQVFLFGIFGILALTLAVIGVYGIMAGSVAQRTHELGIRMALGASAEDNLRLVLKEGMKLAGTGIILGLMAAFAVTRLLGTLLFGVSPRDAVSFVIVAMILVTSALLACWIPARRATRVDPMVALRYE